MKARIKVGATQDPLINAFLLPRRITENFNPGQLYRFDGFKMLLNDEYQ
ncbi:hypothetical protein [Paraburkholderia aromaticivorans]|nr:hypothetical protein [Paraburkholderia aromaticivorans]